jgi:ferric-dicitrate binding protein FerR (iron transport regulator)
MIKVKTSVINRFLNNELSGDELKAFRTEINREGDAFMQHLEQDWETFESNTELPDHIWNNLESQIKPPKSKTKTTKEFRLHWFVKVAASLLILTSAWFVFRSPDVIYTEHGDSPAMVTHINKSDRAETVMLKDGTKVLLGARSILSHYENFNDRYRVVHLEGEAFFETNNQNQRPFIVISQNITAICRGNEFSVSAFKDSEEINVVSASGHIEVAQNDRLNSEYNKVAVESCQRYSFNKSNQQYLIGRVSECDFDEKVRSMKTEASPRTVVML